MFLNLLPADVVRYSRRKRGFLWVGASICMEGGMLAIVGSFSVITVVCSWSAMYYSTIFTRRIWDLGPPKISNSYCKVTRTPRSHGCFLVPNLDTLDQASAVIFGSRPGLFDCRTTFATSVDHAASKAQSKEGKMCLLLTNAFGTWWRWQCWDWEDFGRTATKA